MTGLQGIIRQVGVLVKMLIPIVMGIALLAFFWGLAKFILQSGDEKAVEEGKRIMKWGLIALFVMTSVFGIVTYVQRELGLQGGGIIQIRTIQ